MARPLIVGIGGTTRTGSSGERLVRAVLSATEALGAQTRMFAGQELASLPHFTPEDSQRSDTQRALVEAVRTADGLVIGTPGYHGGISGLVKNAIDLLEDLREDDRPYFDGRAVGTVVVAAGWQACGVTLQALRGVIHAMRGWPTPLGLAVNTIEQKPFDGGRLVDSAILAMVDAQAQQIMRIARP
jgi:FMN reductase